jgi:E3 ubiquitin-protein ligase UBR4
MGGDDGAASASDAPVIGEDCDYDVIGEDAPGGSESMGASDDSGSEEAKAVERMGALRVRGEEGFWTAFQDLLLTLVGTGARKKGALHALAPHCLRPLMRLTPELLHGATPGICTKLEASTRYQRHLCAS